MRRLNWCAPGGVLLVILLFASASAHAESTLQRGAYLVNSIAACGSCHTPRDPRSPRPSEKRLAGGPEFNSPAFTAYSSNITPDPTTGIGRWTDVQIITAIRDGRRPNGSIIGPPMPIGAYRQISDQDVRAIVEYLRSVDPVENAVPASVYRMPLPQSYGPPVKHVAAVSSLHRLMYGRYLATIGHCIECHTPIGRDGRRAYGTELGAGSEVFNGPWGISVSSDITPRGLGQFSDSQLKHIITTGVLPDGMRLKPPMPFEYYARMKASDLDALIAFLRALPAK